MEMEYFVRSEEEGFKYLDFWKAERMKWYTDLGISPERLRFREHEPDELAHYAVAPEDLDDHKNQFGGGGSLGQLPGQLESHHLRHEHRDRLT